MKRFVGLMVKARWLLPVLYLLCAALGLYLASGLTCTDAAATAGGAASHAAAVFEAEFGIPLPETDAPAAAQPFRLPRSALLTLTLAALLCSALAGRSWADPAVLLPGLAVSACISAGAMALLPVPKTAGALCAALVLQAALLSGWSAALLRRFVQACALQGRRPAMEQTLTPLLGAALPGLLPAAALCAALVWLPFTAAQALGWALLAGMVSAGLCAVLLLPALAMLLEPALRALRHRPLIPEGRTLARCAARRRILLPLLALALCAAALWQALRLPVQAEAADGLLLAVLVPPDQAQAASDAAQTLSAGALTPAGPLAPLPAAPEPEVCTAHEFAVRCGVEQETAMLLWSELDAEADTALPLDDVLSYAVSSEFYVRCGAAKAEALSDAWKGTRRFTDLYTVPQAAAAFRMTQTQAEALFSAAGSGRQKLSGRRIVTWQYEQQRLLSSCDDYHAMLTAYDRLSRSDIVALDPLFDAKTVQAMFDYYDVDPDTGALYRYNVLRYAVRNALAEQRGAARQAAAEAALQALRQQQAAERDALPDWPVGPHRACLSYRITGRASEIVSALSGALKDAGCQALLGGPAAEAAETQQALSDTLPRAAVLLPAGLAVLGLLLLRRILPALALAVCATGVLCAPAAASVLCGAPGLTALTTAALLLCTASAACFAAARCRQRFRHACTVRETARRTLEALTAPVLAGCVTLAAGAPALSAVCRGAVLPLCAGAGSIVAFTLLLLPGSLSAGDRDRQPVAQDALL